MSLIASFNTAISPSTSASIVFVKLRIQSFISLGFRISLSRTNRGNSLSTSDGRSDDCYGSVSQASGSAPMQEEPRERKKGGRDGPNFVVVRDLRPVEFLGMEDLERLNLLFVVSPDFLERVPRHERSPRGRVGCCRSRAVPVASGTLRSGRRVLEWCPDSVTGMYSRRDRC